MNNFSFFFYNKLIEDNDGHIFISLYSTSTALSITYKDARENIATEMQNILNILQNDLTKYIFISKVPHKASVEINEEGMEAASATAITMDLDKTMTTEFNADHIFVFLIYSKKLVQYYL